jgi:hypothetical protein
MPTAPRQLCFLTSGERDSAVEHAVHVMRVHTMESRQFPKTNKAFDAPAPPSAMLSKHARRSAEDDARIQAENEILWQKIQSQSRYSEKMQLEELERIRRQGESYAGSNIHRRTKEARRIDHDNRVLAERIARTSPRVTPRTELIRTAKEQEAYARGKSKYRAVAEFPRPPPRSTEEVEATTQITFIPAGAAASGSTTPRLPRVPSARGLATTTAGTDVGPGWAPVYREDLRRLERVRDRRLKGHAVAEGDKPVGERQRTHNPAGWCDRDAAHKSHVDSVRELQDGAAASGDDGDELRRLQIQQ